LLHITEYASPLIHKCCRWGINFACG